MAQLANKLGNNLFLKSLLATSIYSRGDRGRGRSCVARASLACCCALRRSADVTRPPAACVCLAPHDMMGKLLSMLLLL